MSFADDFRAAALPSLLETLGEDVVYTPGSGSPRTIRAIIDRAPPAYPNGNGETVRPRMILECLDDASHGISAASLDTGTDTVTVAYRAGTTAQAWAVAIPEDGKPWCGYGGLRLELS